MESILYSSYRAVSPGEKREKLEAPSSDEVKNCGAIYSLRHRSS
jgi:hypothetical protein